VTYLSQSLNRFVSRAGVGHVGELVSYRNIGFLVAALDFAVITLSSVAAGLAYHYLVLGAQADVSALLGIGANSGLLFILITASSGHYRTRALLSAEKNHTALPPRGFPCSS
jgi:hypothetical protein